MKTAPETIDAGSLADECLNLHYDSFDSLGMEESSIPDDIARAGSVYEAREVLLASIPDLDNPDVDVDEVKFEDYADRLRRGEVPPRIVLRSNLEIIDGWHRALGAQHAGRMTVSAWVARGRK